MKAQISSFAGLVSTGIYQRYCAYVINTKDRVLAHILVLSVTPNINCIVSTLPNERFLSHGMLPLSGHDDVALFV